MKMGDSLQPQPPQDPGKKIGLHATPKGDQVFLREDGSFSVKLKTGGIIHYDDKGEVVTIDEKESTPWPPSTTIETARSEITPEPETKFEYESGQDRTRKIKKSESVLEPEDTASTGRITPAPISKFDPEDVDTAPTGRITPASEKIKQVLERDPMYVEALRKVAQERKVSVSILQQMGLNEKRALRILDDMNIDEIIIHSSRVHFALKIADGDSFEVNLSPEQIENFIAEHDFVEPEVTLPDDVQWADPDTAPIRQESLIKKIGLYTNPETGNQEFYDDNEKLVWMENKYREKTYYNQAGQITHTQFNDGSEEHYNQYGETYRTFYPNGRIRAERQPDYSIKYYNEEGNLTSHLDQQGNEIPINATAFIPAIPAQQPAVNLGASPSPNIVPPPPAPPQYFLPPIKPRFGSKTLRKIALALGLIGLGGGIAHYSHKEDTVATAPEKAGKKKLEGLSREDVSQFIPIPDQAGRITMFIRVWNNTGMKMTISPDGSFETTIPINGKLTEVRGGHGELTREEKDEFEKMHPGFKFR